MTELYSIKDVARIFAEKEARLRYWMQVGFVGPTVRKGGRFYYTFADLIAVKAAKDLLAAGLSLQKVRKNLDALRATLPGDANPALRLRICSDGETVVALEDDRAFEPATRQVVMAFNVPALAGRVAEVMALPMAQLPTVVTAVAANDQVDAEAAPVAVAVDGETTQAHDGNVAYRCFLEGCAAEESGDDATAEHLYRQALDVEPGLAAALTNLGNLAYRRGDRDEARDLYERAVDLEPHQAEARYNLGNLLDDLGDTERAIAEMRQVCALAPSFADAHYNLGLLLARVGGAAQAWTHLARYLELDPSSTWASAARDFMDQIAA